MAPPVNDDLADRILIDPVAGSQALDNTDATMEPGEPTGDGVTRSAWYEWQCPDPAPARIGFNVETALLTAPDPVFTVYDGDASSMAGLTHIANSFFSQTFGGDSGTSYRRAYNELVAPVAGTSYFLQVGTYGAGGALTVQHGPPGSFWGTGVGNDDMADAVDVTGNGSQTVDVSAFTRQLSEAGYDTTLGRDETNPNGSTGQGSPFQSAWWAWTCPDPAPDTATFDVAAVGAAACHMRCYTGDSFQDLTLVDQSDTQIVLTLPDPGTRYLFRAGSDADDFTSTELLTFTWTTEAEEPDPDAVEDAVWQSLEDGGDVPPDTVVTPDLTGLEVLWRVSETYPAPTLDDDTGRPVDWTPTVFEEAWGTVAIAIDGVDVTKVRGVKTLIESLTWQEPFGEGPGQLTIPGASRWDRGTAGFEWLRAEANVDITHHDPDGVFVKNLYSGIVRSVGYGRGGWQLELMGAFAGPAGLMPHRPKLTERERDIGIAATYAIRRAGRGASRRKSITEVEFGIATRDRGSRADTLLEYVTRLLAMAQTVAGDQWTLARVLDDDGHPVRRKYGWRLKDRETVDLTVTVGGRGIQDDLTEDAADLERLQMAEGVDPDGGRWRGTVLPNVGKETVPPYPGTPLDIGSTGDDVTVWQMEAKSDGHRTGDLEALTGGEFTETDADAAREIQESAGLPVTGVVDEDTWDATWSNGDPDLNLGGARFDPIAADPRVVPFLLSSNGSVLAVNPDWDRTLLPVGRMVSYGPDTPRRLAIRSAKADLARGQDLVLRGTIVIDKVDPEEMCRLDIREGMNVQPKHAYGEPLLHVAGVRWTRSGPSWSVTMDVDGAARDLLTLAGIRARNRAAKQDPARAVIAQLRSSGRVRDTPGTWDIAFGKLPPRDCEAGTWNVFKVPAGKYGSLTRVLMRTAPETRFSLVIFGAKVTPAVLNGWMPDPFVDPGDDTYLPWDEPAIVDDLKDHLFVQGYGAHDQRAGYSPGYETHPVSGKATGHPVTGVLDLDTGVQYALETEPIMYVGIFPEDDTTIHGQVRLLPNE